MNAAFDKAVQLHQAGRFAEAEGLYRQALAIEPNLAEAQIGLAAILFQTGRLEEAVAASRRALILRPNSFEACNTLGIALSSLHRQEEALAAYSQALTIQPNNATVYYNAAASLNRLGKRDQAAGALQRAIELKPDFADAMINLGHALVEKGQLEEAATILKRALIIRPDSAEALNLLGKTLKDLGRIEESLEALQKAITLRPDFAQAYNTLGNVLMVMGRLGESLAAYRRAVELDPQNIIAHSNLIFAMNFDPQFDAAAILQEARKWDERHGRARQHLMQPYDNTRDSDRRLRIGYVSPDFRQHVVAWNLLPLLSHHDPEQVEVFCYSSTTHMDAMTDRLRAHAHHWRDVSTLNDEQLALQIREDRIDLLLDLSLHSSGNRLGAFAMAPAPVQITYLGYSGTSGMKAMQYRLSDPHLDPPEMDLSCYSEQTLRLPETYWCYAPPDEAPDLAPAPAEQIGHITFGCMNQLVKASPAAMELWCEILNQVPRSRMILHAQPGRYLEPVTEFLARHGIAPDRLEFLSRQPWNQYMRAYHRIDIALDPFPYNGGITTCDALWMGVPVVTLSGRTSAGRAGRSILSNVNLPEFIARDSNDYVRVAVELAGKTERLNELRQTLRERMKASPLLDAPRFARNVEAAYRAAWQRWVKKGL
jgi:protein O-GlcNAc transferase